MPSISDIALFLREHSIELGLAITIIGAAYTVIRLIFGGIAQFLSWLRIIWHRLVGRSTIPRQTLSIVAEGNSLFCSTGPHYNRTATALSGTWYITNITDHPVSLLAARIKSPRKAAGTEASIKESILQPNASPQRIPIRFTVYPPVHKEGKPFKATIVFIDQYHNEHSQKNILFKVPDHILFRSE
jgi:hypothetical protein